MKSAFFFSLFLFGILSCEKKCKIDCTPDIATINFKILNKQSNQDLFFDSIPVYDTNDLKIFYVFGLDTSYYPIYIKTENNESFFSFEITTETKLYLTVSNSDVDTLYFNYQSDHSKCCPKKIFLYSVDYNKNPFSLQMDKNYVLFYK